MNSTNESETGMKFKKTRVLRTFAVVAFLLYLENWQKHFPFLRWHLVTQTFRIVVVVMLHLQRISIRT